MRCMRRGEALHCTRLLALVLTTITVGAMSTPIAWRDVHDTPSQKKNTIVITAGSTVTIDAPPDKVFDVILAFDKYGEWSRFSPKFDFPAGEKVTVGSKGVMHVHMEAQNKTYKVPEEILELVHDPKEYKISWRGGLLPSWAGKAERVHLITPVEGSDGKQSQVKQWESMSGFASYIFKFLMNVPKQLDESNVLYLSNLKERAESLYKST